MAPNHRHRSSMCLLLLHFLSFWFSVVDSHGSLAEHSASRAVSCIIVFGDSTVDPGNNNYIPTTFKSDFQPYGKDFKNQVPTGRFTNGRLTTDFIASFAGIKDSIPPYLDPHLSAEDLLTGVSFASAGSGFDPLTPAISNVIDIPTQLRYFREYKKTIERLIGKKGMENHISNAAFFVSAGTNDFVINYFTLPIRRKAYSLPEYQHFVVGNIKQFIQSLWDEGARRISVAGLSPMGCLPIVITFNSGIKLKPRGCIEKFSSAARDFNFILQNELNLMQMMLAHLGSRIYYLDTYTPFSRMIQDHQQFGFEEVSYGCCGTGYLETAFLCNPHSDVCPDASKYLFFDSIHPTEKAYYMIFQASRSSIEKDKLKIMCC